MTKANIFMNAGWIGLAGLVATIGASLIGASQSVLITASVICVFACWAMLFTRNADEYTRGLWTSAASMAFATLLILFLALPFIEGIYDGYTAAHAGDGAKPEQDIPALMSISCAIAAFYIGLFWKRIRGG